MKVPASLRWAGLALLGIVIAAAVSVAASRLASQQIGLASEPISAGDALAPARQEHRPVPVKSQSTNNRNPNKHANGTHLTPPPTAPALPATPVESTPSPPAEEVEPSHSGGDGEHGGGGADD